MNGISVKIPEVDDEILIESPLSGAMSKFPTGRVYRVMFIYNLLDIVQCIKNHLGASFIERSRLQLAILQVAFCGAQFEKRRS